jgi:UDP-N-acetylmuramoyl-L-alanyl-D-glutamate--2,6-diaminopimelate ligase
MKLEKIIEGLNPLFLRGTSGAEITGICHDSRHYQEGELFVAIRGNQFDGHLFIDEACRKGAPAIVLEDERVVPIRYAGVVLKVANAREALDVLAANFYEKPSEKLFVAGVTGTNGKTTTSLMIEAVLNGGGLPTGVIGTIDNHLGGEKIAATHTTPDALDTQRLMSTWLAKGACAVSMEVSSHALALRRVESIQFDAAVFTNMTRDHLDFHRTMDEYIKAKARLFRDLLARSTKKSKRAIMNAEDPHLSALRPEGIPLWTYGFSAGDIRAEKIETSFAGTTFEVATPAGREIISLQMIGNHNVANAMAAIGVALHAGMKLTDIAKALHELSGVRGRLERVQTKGALHVFVDYAHTDDALKNVLSVLRGLRDEKFRQSRIVTVFGCGGDRDKGKRPLMMKTVQHYSDVAVVTSDNPRTEDPNKIIADILLGASPDLGADAVVIEPDRKKAIALAIKRSSPGDVILIAGKGHEDYQIIGNKKFPFDDIAIAKEYLER